MKRKKRPHVSKKKTEKIGKPLLKKKKTGALPEKSTSKTKVRVIGIGGGGGSIISEISTVLAKVDFIAANTDKRSLRELSKKVKTFHFGEKMTGGFGTGMDPEIGKMAAEEEKEKIKKLFEGQDICVIVSSLGGGTGSGATPVFAKIAKDSGCITYGIFTLPFNFEGSKKMEIAKRSLEEIKPYINALSVLPNENIFKIVEKNAPLKEALSMINSNLSESLKGLIEAIYNPGLINIDFADLRTVLEGRGKLAYINTLLFDVTKDINEAIKRSMLNPFYSYGIERASGVLLNITGSKKVGLQEVSQISQKISEIVKKNAAIIIGIAHENSYENKMKVMILAIGCESENVFPQEKKREPSEVKESKKKKKKKSGTISKHPKKKEENPPDKASLQKDQTVRRNALETKKATEDAEKKILEEEQRWETPAFLRRGTDQ